MIIKKQYFLATTLLMLLVTACEKPPGEGGTSTITGRIYIRDYNANFTLLQDQFYAMEERVYIIYGGDTTQFYDDDIRTSYDGTYEFRNLRKGSYAIFAYSDDSTFTVPGGAFPVFRNVEITDDNQTVELPLMILLK